MRFPQWVARESLPVKRFIATLSLVLGLYHLLAAFGVPRFWFIADGWFLNLVQAFAFISASVLIKRDVRKQTPANTSSIPRDEAVIQAIRERAVDYAVEAHRHGQERHA